MERLAGREKGLVWFGKGNWLRERFLTNYQININIKQGEIGWDGEGFGLADIKVLLVVSIMTNVFANVNQGEIG